MLCKTRLFSIFLPFAIFFTGVSCAEQHCDQINKTIPNLHLHCGYNLTARYTHGHHFNSASRAIISLKNVLKNCSLFVDTMICSLFLPRCTEEISGPYLPCRGVCYDFANDCNEIIRTRGLEWTVAMCDILPEKDNPKTTKGYRERCFTPPNYIVSGKNKSNKADGIPTNSTDKSSTSDENPSTTTDIPSPAVKGLQKDKRSPGPNKLLVGCMVTFAFLILIVLGVVGFVWYRRKKVRQFDYQKQVLYSEDREDEFQIFT